MMQNNNHMKLIKNNLDLPNSFLLDGSFLPNDTRLSAPTSYFSGRAGDDDFNGGDDFSFSGSGRKIDTITNIGASGEDKAKKYPPPVLIYNLKDVNYGFSGNKSNAIGDWFKKTFGNTTTETSSATSTSVDQAAAALNTTPSDLEALHKKSKTAQKLSDWLNSPKVKIFLSNLAQQGKIALAAKAKEFVNQNNPSVPNFNIPGLGTYNIPQGNDVPPPPPPLDKKILGMHPVTFGIVAFLGIGAIVVGGILISRSMKNKAAAGGGKSGISGKPSGASGSASITQTA